MTDPGMPGQKASALLYTVGACEMMKHRVVNICIAAAALCVVAANCSAAESTTRPKNVVLVLVDDQRADQLGFLNPLLETPVMDRIANEGLHFRNAYVTTSLCSPSRASILTGTYAHRHHIIDNESRDVAPGLQFFPELLQEAGYQTAFVGKWHMGHKHDAPRSGFDHWVSFAGQGSYFPKDFLGRQSMFNVDGEAVAQQGYITDELTDYALDWLKEVERDKPFFLYLSHKAVHAEFAPAPRHRELYADIDYPHPKTEAATAENLRGKPAWVRDMRNSFHGVEFPFMNMPMAIEGGEPRSLDTQGLYRNSNRALRAVDESLGRVIAWLEEAGLVRDTVVMLIGDNGFMWGEHGLLDKRNAYEDSIRVPLLVYAPGTFAGGRRISEIVANIDIAPTILDIAGIEAPGYMQGRSFLPMAYGNPVDDWRDALVYEYYWEWTFPVPPTTFALITDRYKFIQYHGVWDTDELYDTAADPDELNNLVLQPEHADRVREMRTRLYTELRQQFAGNPYVPYTMKRTTGMVWRSRDGSAAGEFPDAFYVKPDDPKRFDILRGAMKEMMEDPNAK